VHIGSVRSLAATDACTAEMWGLRKRERAKRENRERTTERKLARVPTPRVIPREPKSLLQANITIDHRSQITEERKERKREGGREREREKERKEKTEREKREKRDGER